MINSENKERFLDIYNRNIKRAGADRLLEWMDNRTDFFTAPASTKFHGACKEGLVIHSLNVYDILKKGSEVAEAAAQATLDEVKKAMQIDYFNDSALIAEQARRFGA